MTFKLKGGKKTPTLVVKPNGSSAPTATVDTTANESISPILARLLHRPGQFLFFLFTGFLFFSLIGLVGLYTGYQYLESPQFCGTVCHPMQPEYLRYQRSEHAHVRCVDCHVGPGLKYLVESKLEGLRQVYAVATDSYHRPILPSLYKMRPARETCEECHRPTSFKDNVIKNVVHYDNDENNTRIQSTFILKLGGFEEISGISQGIHWHITNPVYYIAGDERQQVILWVGIEQADGTMKEFFLRDLVLMAQTSFVDKAWKEGRVRKMDCMDCHNRTAHFIPSPEQAVDRSITAGRIPKDLPYIRARAVAVLKPLYESNEEAYAAIDGLREFYLTEYPDVYQTRREDIEKAIAEVKRIYDETNFPEYRLNWQSHPNNERHSPFPGCFRCHDDKHVRVDSQGKEIETITAKCNLCHTVPIVSRGDEQVVESPVITGPIPETHSDFRWTVEHRSITPVEEQECYQCHGQAFCNNGICHNLSHPPDMLYTHADEFRKRGNQVCYICHQNVLCSRCHVGDIIENP